MYTLTVLSAIGAILSCGCLIREVFEVERLNNFNV